MGGTRERTVRGNDLRTWLAVLAGMAAILAIATRVFAPVQPAFAWCLSALLTGYAALMIRGSVWVVVESTPRFWITWFVAMVLVLAILATLALSRAEVPEIAAFVWIAAVIGAAALLRVNPWQATRILFYALFFLVIGSAFAAAGVREVFW